MADKTKKIVQIVDGDTPGVTLTVEQLSEWGALPIFIIAEDIDDAGVYQMVQGQFNDDGNFELLTAGSGTAEADTDNILMETGDNLLLETGDQFLIE